MSHHRFGGSSEVSLEDFATQRAQPSSFTHASRLRSAFHHDDGGGGGGGGDDNNGTRSYYSSSQNDSRQSTSGSTHVQQSQPTQPPLALSSRFASLANNDNFSSGSNYTNRQWNSSNHNNTPGGNNDSRRFNNNNNANGNNFDNENNNNSSNHNNVNKNRFQNNNNNRSTTRNYNNNQQQQQSQRQNNYNNNSQTSSAIPNREYRGQLHELFNNVQNQGRQRVVEAQIFGDRDLIPRLTESYRDIPVTTQGTNIPSPIQDLATAQLHSSLAKNMSRAGYTQLTPIQKHSLSYIFHGRDTMASAQTGSGKTAAFLLPIIQTLLSYSELYSSHEHPFNTRGVLRNPQGGSAIIRPLALVLAPTRELVVQITKEAMKFTFHTPVHVGTVYGGVSSSQQLVDLRRGGCTILIATPGRLVDQCTQGFIVLTHIRHFVLDEADRMLDMGFFPQINQVVRLFNMPAKPQHTTPSETQPLFSLRNAVEQLQGDSQAIHQLLESAQQQPPTSRCTFLFSATFPSEIQKIAAEFLHDSIRVTVGRIGSSTDLITQVMYKVSNEDKMTQLLALFDPKDQKEQQQQPQQRQSQPPPDSSPASSHNSSPRDSTSLPSDEQLSNSSQESPSDSAVSHAVSHVGFGVRPTLIFVNTKRLVSRLENYLYQHGHSAVGIHGAKSQAQRESALEMFSSGRCSILVATDVAARGLSIIPSVEFVLNFDLPTNIDDYVHRIGRTGRCGARGVAIGFVSPNDLSLTKDLLKVMVEAKQNVPQWFQAMSHHRNNTNNNHHYHHHHHYNNRNFNQGGSYFQRQNNNNNNNNNSTNNNNFAYNNDNNFGCNNNNNYNNNNNSGNSQNYGNFSQWNNKNRYQNNNFTNNNGVNSYYHSRQNNNNNNNTNNYHNNGNNSFNNDFNASGSMSYARNNNNHSQHHHQQQQQQQQRLPDFQAQNSQNSLCFSNTQQSSQQSTQDRW